ncbi:DNA replication/repair protein RecF [Rheinheimera sp.]|uniref:DNA replication/repair protein RecF n=1 Tax=Rheinheimera sp. TaxID=1869214 RepID=UPI00307D8BA2
MALRSLRLHRFRNIELAELAPHPGINLVCGANGSGKTSVLEAVYLLAHGRSFRSNRLDKIIRHHTDDFILHASIDLAGQAASLGIQRQREQDLLMRLNGDNLQRLSDLALLLPVQLVTPETFKLLLGGPKERRQFFDMGLFHVEQRFFPLWSKLQRILKHRNALLKTQKRYNDEYAYWDQNLAELSFELHGLRQSYIETLTQALNPLMTTINWAEQLELQLYAGWPERIQSAAELQQLWQQNFSQDLRLGHSQYGPQKADLKLKVQQQAVEELLSRGQLKVLLFALKVAQNNLIYSYGQKRPVLLIDDLASELDDNSKRHIFSFLNTINSQVFITAINADQVLPSVPEQNPALFHVEQGQITKRTE